MGFRFDAATDGSSVADIFVPVVVLALVVTIAFAVAAARRARSRRGHAQVESTGCGLWEGTISDWDLIWLFPETNSTRRGPRASSRSTDERRGSGVAGA